MEIGLSGGRLRLLAGSELLLAGDIPDGFPTELTGVALAVNSPDGVRRTALFDWVEVQMTGGGIGSLGGSPARVGRGSGFR